MRRVWGPQLLDDHTICFGTFQEELLQSFLQVEQGRNVLKESLQSSFVSSAGKGHQGAAEYCNPQYHEGLQDPQSPRAENTGQERVYVTGLIWY